VTLIVGIICKDGIVLAADSQTTKGSYEGAAKVVGTEKISVVEFANGSALVAESGAASISGAAIEIFKRKAAKKEIVDDMTVARTAEEAVREIRARIESLYPKNLPLREWQDFFYQPVNNFELMVAFYHNGKPFIYTLEPASCIPVTSPTAYFFTSGIASNLATYVLKEHTQKDMDYEFASVVAIKVVKAAIDNVEGCGEPIKAAVIRKETTPFLLENPLSIIGRLSPPRLPEIRVYPPESIAEISKIVSAVEIHARKTQNKKIQQALRKKTEKVFKDLEKLVKRIKKSNDK